MRRLAGVLVLGLGLLAPMAVAIADDHPRHEWSDNEDPNWRQYLKERHRSYHDWGHATKKEQRAYWRWRDAHPDHH